MKNKPLVSVIIPTYNRAAMLLKTIESILKQDYSNIEIIIVDDGSTDNTFSILNELGNKKILYLNYERTSDIARLRNIGISASKGEFIAFCDDDDLWFPNKLSKQVPLLSFYDMICTNAIQIDENDIGLDKLMVIDKLKSQKLDTKTLLLANYIVTSSVIIKRSSLKHRFVERKSNYSAEDYELWLKISLNYNIYYLDDILVSFRRHLNTTSFDGNLILIKLLREVIERLKEYVQFDKIEIRSYAKIGIIKQRRELLKIYYKSKSYLYLLIEISKSLFYLFNPFVILYAIRHKVKKIHSRNFSALFRIS